MNREKLLYGGIEAGGTKFVCVVGTDPETLEEVVRFPTTSPEETLGRTLDFFKDWKDRIAGIGIGSFGPLDIRPESETYGCIEKTPKPGWTGTDILSTIRELGVPTAIHMDVAASAIGEYTWGAGQDLRNLLYITVGTGIGATALLDGKPLSGLAASEMGHLFLPAAEADDFKGSCPFHGRCLEGIASGPAIAERWGRPGKDLGENHPAWELEAEYLAAGIVNYILVLSPERIIAGGGVMQQGGLFPLIRRKIQNKLNGYVDRIEITERIDEYLVEPGLGSRSGILGCLVMAKNASD
jgi:fructokinase